MSVPIEPGDLFVFEDDVSASKEYLMFIEEKKEDRVVSYHFLSTTGRGETEKTFCLKSWFEFGFNKGIIKRRIK